ncbi:MAG: BREX-3 system P-loop-containing protein BrxF [Geopsychrobacter sp.]|nr:BREX-3 system P-loop-containing protein BrxF [Geopsychrobacter sp.]
MTSVIFSEIHSALEAAKSLYHRMVLVVGKAETGKTIALRETAESFNVDVINVNLVISEELLGLTMKQRTLRLPEILARITDVPASPVILDNLEILFDKDLKQDPLRLLQSISRNRSVLASWNGSIANGKLIYAEQGHPEHKKYDASDIQTITISEPASDGTREENREAVQI